MTPTIIPLRFERLQETYAPILKTWFADPELGRWIQLVLDDWIPYVLTSPISHVWLAYDGETPVGFAAFDFAENNLGYMAFAVDPAHKRRGYGKAILEGLLELPEIKTLKRIAGFVEPENAACQRCLLSAGYKQVNETPDEDGLLLWAYDLQ